VLAPAAGTVTYVLDGRPDQAIGSADGHYQSGNNIVIEIGCGRYFLMAHLTPGSIQAEVGDHVELGQQLPKWETPETRLSPICIFSPRR
jgi:murein DD-endopeptidase MepM/ murein hydrolase activator NlpD